MRPHRPPFPHFLGRGTAPWGVATIAKSGGSCPTETVMCIIIIMQFLLWQVSQGPCPNEFAKFRMKVSNSQILRQKSKNLRSFKKFRLGPPLLSLLSLAAWEVRLLICTIRLPGGGRRVKSHPSQLRLSVCEVCWWIHYYIYYTYLKVLIYTVFKLMEYLPGDGFGYHPAFSVFFDPPGIFSMFVLWSVYTFIFATLLSADFQMSGIFPVLWFWLLSGFLPFL